MVKSERWLTKRRLLIAAVALTLFAVGRWHSAYLHGALDAWVDRARGQSKFKSYGYVMGWEGEYRRLLRDRYGVTVEPVAGCLVTEDLVRYVHGYNDVSCARLQARFGKDIFAECKKEARTAWKQLHPGD